MATILEFRQGHRSYGSHLGGSQRGGSSTPAEIVFFPGVRYERWEDTPPEAKSKKRLRRRDRLEIDG
jgi:hypothetical protein